MGSHDPENVLEIFFFISHVELLKEPPGKRFQISHLAVQCMLEYRLILFFLKADCAVKASQTGWKKGEEYKNTNNKAPPGGSLQYT